MTDMTQTPASSTAQASSFAPARLPQIIQGGMGVAVSDWRLAQAVSRTGQLGVVSGTGIDNVLVRRLQDGDKEGDVRRALAAYPNQDKAQEIIARYFIEGGKEPHKPYARIALPTHRNHKLAWELSIAGGFVEVWLAREGHDYPVGLNLLTKLELMTMPALYGAMLAGVDTVIMGAGIPREVPAALDSLSAGKPGTFKLSVKGDPQGETPSVTLDPAEYGFGGMTTVRPKFYPIITSHVLAGAMLRKKTGEINGFVIEGPTAGGHNAPPRGNYELDDLGQPIYGERDVCDLAEMRKFGLPFWLAGGYGKRGGLQDALEQGAAGIQVGTLFAYAKEAGIRDDLQAEVLERVQGGNLSVYTDPLASPTGFPFKVVQLPETLSNPEVYAARQRICDIGYLREAYWETGEGKQGKVGWRCAAEPVDQYVAKGGKIEDTVGRKCLCNALMADAGLPQVQRGGDVEKSLLTSGDGLTDLGAWKPGYTAADAVAFLRGEEV